MSVISKNAITVLEKRYLAKDAEGNNIETVEEMFRRVASTIASADKDILSVEVLKKNEEDFYQLMTNLEFLPNSPTLMNAGRPIGQLAACALGSTVIHTLRGEFTIKQLSEMYKPDEEFGVYCCDGKGIKVGKAFNARLTRKDAKVLKVGLRLGKIYYNNSGFFRENTNVVKDGIVEISLTPDHLVMMRDGSYKRTDELRVGESVMPFNHRYNGNECGEEGRLVIYKGIDSKPCKAHRFVYEECVGEIKEDIHHRDGDKKNNEPNNLEDITNKEHSRYHMTINNPLWVDEAKKKISENMRNNNPQKDPKNVDKMLLGRAFKTIDNILSDGLKVTKHLYEEYCVGKPCPSIIKMVERGIISSFEDLFNKYEEARSKELCNHEIISIEDGGSGDVYDMSVHTYHNFAANGIFIHNCFVLPIEDSMEGIFDAIKHAAMIHKSGGGTGFSFNRLRPKGSTVNSTGGVASGPVSFMKVFNAATEAVKQGGCFVGSTLIATIKGPKAIKDLKEGDLVYTWDGEYKLMPCTDSWKTKTNTEVWKLITDKGLEVFATPDHPIMVRWGKSGRKKEYIKLKDLKIGTPLMPLTRYIKDKEEIYITLHDGNDTRLTEHTWVAKQFDILGEHIHHKDENHFNNSPENLEGVSHTEHASYHMKKLVASGEHPFLNLTQEQRENGVEYCNERNHKVVSVEFSHYEDVYNVEVPVTHNYVVCSKDMMSGVVVSNTRRGANMGILNVDHPDILEFISCKADNADITNFNISVGITEDFMHAVENDNEYHLIDPKTKQVVLPALKARVVFDKIVEMAWKNGEPGIIFLDRINKTNPLISIAEVESTNPCGEQPLLPNEACNLGSINLTTIITKIKSKFEIDWFKLDDIVGKAVHFLDNVVSANTYPLPQIDEMTKSTRKIGLGVMGWADLLYILGIPYDSEEALELGEEIMEFIQTKAWNKSRELAVEKGAFPLWENSTFKETNDLVRNATTTTIAPTGTLSIISNVSSGVEPVFAISYIRNVMDNSELAEVNSVFKAKAIEEKFYSESLMRKIAEEGTLKHIDEIPKEVKRVFVTSHDIAPVWHVRMQAAFQKGTDNAVSKTVNLSHDATQDDVREVFLLAYKLECKGVTIYRDGSRDMQVLNIKEVKGKEVIEAPLKLEEKLTIIPRERPEITTGFTEKVKIGCGNLYITVNSDDKGICEVFSNTGRAGGCSSQSEATSRLVSIALRAGIDAKAIIEQLKGIRCPSTTHQKGLKVTSCPDAIGRLLEKVVNLGNDSAIDSLKRIVEKKIVEKKSEVIIKTVPVEVIEPKVVVYDESLCPECHKTVEHSSGCVVCRNCGWGRCS